MLSGTGGGTSEILQFPHMTTLWNSMPMPFMPPGHTAEHTQQLKLDPPPGFFEISLLHLCDSRVK